MAKLYEISNELNVLLENGFTSDFINEDGEIDEAKVAERIGELQMALEEKLDDIACYLKDLKADATKIEEEAKALKERAARLRVKQASLEDYVVKVMEQNGKARIDTTRNIISLIHAKKTEITNELLLPEEYIKVKTTTAPDKEAIKKALIEGKTVDGAKLVESVSLKLK